GQQRAVVGERTPHGRVSRVRAGRVDRLLDAEIEADGTTGRPGSDGHERLDLRVRLRAVPTADVGDGDAYVAVRQPEDTSEVLDDHERVLSGAHHFQATVVGEPGARVVRLHGIRVQRGMEGGRGDDVI